MYGYTCDWCKYDSDFKKLGDRMLNISNESESTEVKSDEDESTEDESDEDESE